MGNSKEVFTIVFSDIVGSSRLYASLGNERAKEKIDQALLCMQSIVEQHGGNVIKTLGDEIMCTFSNADDACKTAIALNLKLNAMHFYLRTGMCFGQVIRDDGDVYGDAVNSAAYLAKSAQANQILFDENTFANLFQMRERSEFFDRIHFKNQHSETIVYRLNWENEKLDALSATQVASQSFAKLDPPQRLILHSEGISHFVDTINPVIIGRDKSVVQICVAHKNASRKHCTIVFHKGKFILQDHSTNGTYLQQDGQKEVFLKRESTPLMYDGTITLGQPQSKSAPKIDYFLE